MNDFFGEQQVDEQAIQEETEDQQTQEVEEESDLTEDGAVEIASDEQDEEDDQTDDEIEDLREKLKLANAEIEDIKVKADNWVRSIQSGHDKKLAELQRQVQTLLDSQSQVEESSFDEDDYLTGSQMKKFMEQERKKELTLKEQEKQKQDRIQAEKLQEAQNWLYSQPDVKEVWDFYDKNLKNDPMLNQLDYQAQYFYVKSKMREQETKPAINKKNKKNKFKKEKLPPVGNPNRNFSSSASGTANSIMTALKNRREALSKDKGFFN